MSEDNLDEDIQQNLDSIGLNVDWRRRVSAGDVLYLLDQCPFLQISDTSLQLSYDLPPLKVVTAKSGWRIHDYGNALSSSPGEWMFGNPRARRTRIDGEQKGGEGGGSGVGTVVNQAVLTVFDMIELVKAHEWAGIRLVDGHPLMAWAAWMYALDSGLEVEGYSPTAKDLARRRRIKGAAPGPGATFRP
jgi:hypothetical protein